MVEACELEDFNGGSIRVLEDGGSMEDFNGGSIRVLEDFNGGSM